MSAAWLRLILILLAWGIFCGAMQAPVGVPFVGGMILGYWFSPFWEQR